MPPAVTLIELCDLASRVLTSGSGNTATILDSLTERRGILAAQAAEVDLPGLAQLPENRKLSRRMQQPTLQSAHGRLHDCCHVLQQSHGTSPIRAGHGREHKPTSSTVLAHLTLLCKQGVGDL